MQLTIEKPVVDGFLLSATMRYLTTSYRASALAQMEVLRRAKSYRTRWYLVPEELESPIPAYSQLEYQVGVLSGSYVWGLTFAAVASGEVSADTIAKNVRVQITDTCTETPFFSDYTKGKNFVSAGTSASPRSITLLTPRIIGEPAMLNVELYNSLGIDVTVQLAILVAEPMVPPEHMKEVLIAAGLAQQIGG